jgi:hypothetical protein
MEITEASKVDHSKLASNFEEPPTNVDNTTTPPDGEHDVTAVATLWLPDATTTATTHANGSTSHTTTTTTSSTSTTATAQANASTAVPTQATPTQVSPTLASSMGASLASASAEMEMSRPFSVVKNDVSLLLHQAQLEKAERDKEKEREKEVPQAASQKEATPKPSPLTKSASKLESILKRDEKEKGEKKEKPTKADKHKAENKRATLPESSEEKEPPQPYVPTEYKRFDVYVLSITTTSHQKELMLKACLGDGHMWTSPSLKVSEKPSEKREAIFCISSDFFFFFT